MPQGEPLRRGGPEGQRTKAERLAGQKGKSALPQCQRCDGRDKGAKGKRDRARQRPTRHPCPTEHRRCQPAKPCGWHDRQLKRPRPEHRCFGIGPKIGPPEGSGGHEAKQDGCSKAGIAVHRQGIAGAGRQI